MHQPLPEVYPEYCVVEHAQGGREFRVESKGYFQSQRAPARNYTGLIDYVLALIVPILGAVAWQMPRRWILILCILICLIPFGYRKATQVLWESVIVLPSKDLQLEVHRGPLGRSMFVERRVISASTISAIIINEALHGWNVRFYLAVLTKVDENQSMHVLYENQLPRMPVLRDVHHNLQTLLYNKS
ncbi:hypothetical protein BJ322DRAFT_72878 [Thelephora terrestris]|uniref:Phosphatidylinositol N-acetylglucosaminyltransferase subunit H conserved domain-containing protein n=1 Tax=Thelephora terrestris TaxID=56493 RepID=A0A9P6HQE9_9AGAM|nr:hypothetical protein BJ322DRAFT_72878 [Thelephora terrestris]